MVKWLKYLITVLIVAMGCVWLGTKTPPGQRLVTYSLEQLFRRFGVGLTIQNIDIANLFQFCFRDYASAMIYYREGEIFSRASVFSLVTEQGRR